jgi:hypothetical protein
VTGRARATTPTALEAVLGQPNPAVLGFVRPDGKPNTVATWYQWENGRALVNVDEGRRRLEYLRENPSVSLTVLDGDSWDRHIALHGRRMTREGDPSSATSNAARATTAEPYAQRDRGRLSGWIQIESWLAWNDGPWT